MIDYANMYEIAYTFTYDNKQQKKPLTFVTRQFSKWHSFVKLKFCLQNDIIRCLYQNRIKGVTNFSDVFFWNKCYAI